MIVEQVVVAVYQALRCRRHVLKSAQLSALSKSQSIGRCAAIVTRWMIADPRLFTSSQSIGRCAAIAHTLYPLRGLLSLVEVCRALRCRRHPGATRLGDRDPGLVAVYRALRCHRRIRVSGRVKSLSSVAVYQALRCYRHIVLAAVGVTTCSVAVYRALRCHSSSISSRLPSQSIWRCAAIVTRCGGQLSNGLLPVVVYQALRCHRHADLYSSVGLLSRSLSGAALPFSHRYSIRQAR